MCIGWIHMGAASAPPVLSLCVGYTKLHDFSDNQAARVVCTPAMCASLEQCVLHFQFVNLLLLQQRSNSAVFW
jgi:hypothetical protein